MTAAIAESAERRRPGTIRGPSSGRRLATPDPVRRILDRFGNVGPALLILAGLSSAQARGEVAPSQQPRSDLHLGVVTCAGNTCHGAPKPLPHSRVQQNEFTIWHRQDKHAKAYTVLFNENSKRLARNLGLPAAHTAKECLDCHADNVPADQRGKRFQLDDGVSCEACHGGGERYLGPHVSGENSHAKNVGLGLYPTDEPKARAELCLTCHLGTKDRFTTHRIMGAGHPRISFELDTFTQIQPAHFKRDKDYLEGGKDHDGVRVWAVGQVTAVEQFVELLLEPRYQGSGVMPELAFFDCHACHRPMKRPRWSPRVSMALGPGRVHLNDSGFLMLRCIAARIAPSLGEQLGSELYRLHQTTLVGITETRNAAARIRPLLAEIRAAIVGHPFSPGDTRALAADIVEAGLRGDYNDYVGAEQAVMALGALAATLGLNGGFSPKQTERVESSLRDMEVVLKDENAYDPERLIASLKTMERSIRSDD
jgi:Cytochrome c554 and c-prime